MPGFDGRGPRGMGPIAGGGRGFCAVPLSVSGTELDFLTNQMNNLKAQLRQIEARIKDLTSAGVKSTEGRKR
ncbi:DUF5320 domain-containing protein [Chloroflexota bacterium]